IKGIKRLFFDRNCALHDRLLLLVGYFRRTTYRSAKKVEDISDFERIWSPDAFDPSQQCSCYVLGFDPSAAVEKVRDQVQRVGKARYRGGALDDCPRCEGRFCTDNCRNVEEKTCCNTGKNSPEPRTVQSGCVLTSKQANLKDSLAAAFLAGHQSNLTPSWISRGGLVLVTFPNPPRGSQVACPTHVVFTSRNCV